MVKVKHKNQWNFRKIRMVCWLWRNMEEILELTSTAKIIKSLPLALPAGGI